MLTQQDKLDREIAKLDWEIKHLKRPIWKTPTGIAAMLAASVALVGSSIQYLNSTVDKKLAEIEKLETKAATLKLVEQKAKTEEELVRLKSEAAQVAETKLRLEEQYKSLTKFFHDNPNIQNAQALVATLHKALYPLSFQQKFKKDSVVTLLTGKLSSNGDLAVTVEFGGVANADKLSTADYVILIKDIETNQQLVSFNMGKQLVTGKKLMGSLRSFEWKKTFTFKVEEAVINRIFLDSQLSIAASK